MGGEGVCVIRIRNLRWWIVALICLGTIINYLARNSLAVLAPQLKAELRITTEQYSYVVGAFQLAYTLMQPVCGWIIDHVGLRIGFALFAVAWSAANMLHALAGGWQGLALFRGLLGLTEAAAIPAGIKAIAEWFPATRRSVAVGWFNVGTSLGALLAPPLVIAISLQAGWRAAFLVTGAAGLAWAALWFAFYRAPGCHPAIGPDEMALIGERAEATSSSREARVSALLTGRRFWALAVPRFLIEPAWQTFSFWIPLYLATERGMDLKQIALFAWLPFLAADLGGVVGGYLSPLLMNRFGAGLTASRVYGFAGASILMIAPGCTGLASSPFAAIALFCVGGFAHQVLSVLVNTLTADAFPAAAVGTANGFVGMAGWTGGLLFSLAVGQLADGVGYAPLFAALAVFDLAAAAWLLANRRSIEAPQ